jgi:2-C-methyl-D-erythritol 4-phosphate cytidylyltransferase
MLEWSLAALRAVEAVEHVVVALPPGESAPDGTLGVPGGRTRSHSVREALRAAPSPADGRVVVHDAARPLAEPELFARALAALEDADAAIAAAPVTDTVKRADAERRVTATLDRAGLWAVQTPQAFRAETLRRALDVPDEVLAAATDDASLVERVGGIVRLVESPPDNLKVTTPLDLRIAEALLAERERPC